MVMQLVDVRQTGTYRIHSFFFYWMTKFVVAILFHTFQSLFDRYLEKIETIEYDCEVTLEF